MSVALTLWLHIVASLALLVLTTSVSWKRRRSIDSVLGFLIMVGMYSLWSASTAILRLWSILYSPSDLLGSIAGMFGTAVGWSVLFYSLRAREKPLEKLELGILWSTGLITIGMCVLPFLPGFVTDRRVVDGVVVGQRGVFFYVTSIWTFFLVFVGLGLVIRARRREQRPVHRRRMSWLIAGIGPASVAAFAFTFLQPAVSAKPGPFAWIGPATAVFVSSLLFLGISRYAIYDLQTGLHRTIFLIFLASVCASSIYIPVGVSLSSEAPGRFTIPTGLFLLVLILLSHSAFAYFYPMVSGYLLGRMRNPEDIVRQVLGLAADVDRDADEVCRDVSLLLKFSFQAERAVVALPAERRFRIVVPDGGDVSSSHQLALLKILNARAAVTRAAAVGMLLSPADLDVKNIGPAIFDGRRHPRMLRKADALREELTTLGFDVFMPVVYGRRVLAVFLLGGKSGKAPFFQSEHSTLRTLAAALGIALKNVDEYSRIVRVNTALLQQGEDPVIEPIQRTVHVAGESEIVYRGRRMEQAIEEIEKAALHDESVLILGETGSGKDLAAHLIHAKSARSEKPFIAVNCGAIADSLLENELFGHERGAYTGADKRYQGLFEQADGGVLFLDEIGEISENLQVKLLRVIEDRKVPRLGGAAVRVDIRLIAATNRDLRARVEEGLFRADLFYRLNVITIRMPRLVDRPEDIPALADHFLRKFAKRFGRERMRLSGDAVKRLQAYHWPGNVRELQNMLLRAMTTTSEELLKATDFPDLGLAENTTGRAEIPGVQTQRRPGETLDDFMRRIENVMIQDALVRSNGNKAQAARDLGLSRTTFYHKIGLMDKGAAKN